MMRFSRYLTYSFLLIASVCSGSLAQLPSVQIRDTEVRYLKSAHVEGMEYEIHIALPRDYHAATDSYSVVYYPDAYWWGGIVIETYRLLRTFNEIPPLLLVGISYRDTLASEAYRFRQRDLIPTKVDRSNLGEYDESPPLASGGSDAFLRFIQDELKPMIAGHYRVKEDGSGLIGISNGALFGAYVLFTDPATFDKYLLGSPRLDRDNFVTLRFEEQYYAQHRSLPATVFLSTGTEDWEFIVLSWLRLKERLLQRNYRGLEMITHAFEGENHTSCIPATISRGLRALYGKNRKD